MTMVSVSAVDVIALPVQVNLDIYQGDDFYLDLTVTDSMGNPVDTSGWTASAVIRPAPGSKVLATFTCTLAGNVIHLHLPHTEAVNLQRRGVWDCQIATGGGNVTTLAGGKVSAGLEVTTA